MALLQQRYAELSRALGRRGIEDPHSILHDLWLRLRVTPGSGAEIADPWRYLLRALRNQDTEGRRASWRHQKRVEGDGVPESLPDTAPDLEMAAVRRQQIARLSDTLDALPSRCREIFLLHRFEGLTHAQIASRLGISASLVDKSIARALRACLDSMLEAPSRNQDGQER